MVFALGDPHYWPSRTLPSAEARSLVASSSSLGYLCAQYWWIAQRVTYEIESMKYSLRSLMIVVTLVCVVLGGGRIEYLRRWAVFHEREAIRSANIIEQKHHIPVDLIKNFYDPNGPFQSNLGDRVGYFLPTGERYEAKIDQNFLDYDRHRKLAVAYRAAAYRPWSTIAEPTSRPLTP
jgi:hypothetical protein